MVFGSMIFFVVEVSIRTKDYFKYETNIDIELRMEDQIPFPALTMCNQNAFRMTRAVDLGLYHFLDEVYARNVSSGNLKGSFNFLDVTVNLAATFSDWL